MQRKIPIHEIVTQLRQEMVRIDVVYVTRTVALFLNALTAANADAMRDLLLTEIPIKPALAMELGLAQRVKESGKCVATCLDLLVYICGFIRYPDGRITGSLTTVYDNDNKEQAVQKIRGFTPLTDIPLATLASADDALSDFLLQTIDSTNKGLA